MIKRVEVIFRETGSWARGSAFDVSPNVLHRDGEILFSRNYSKETPTRIVWEDIKKNMTNFFYDIFYPSVVWNTRFATGRPDDSEVALRGQSDHVRRKRRENPELYSWNEKLRKWHMTFEGYVKRTTELGGDLDIGVGTDLDDMFDYTLIDNLEKSGETISLFLFVYPDRYDQIIRAMFQLNITFW